MHAYIGSYAPHGQGIYGFEQVPGSPGLRPLGLAAAAPNPSYLALSDDQTLLYVANEHEDFQGRLSGSVSAYRREPATGAITLAGCVASGGARPVHLSLCAQERHLFVANYGCGSLAVLALKAGGGLGQRLDLQSPDVLRGAPPFTELAQQAAPGSFALSDHDGPHAHMAQPDPSGRWLLSTDLGLDQLTVWRFDAGTGRLSQPRRHAASSPGAGPRHLRFHPRFHSQGGTLCYVLNEAASTLSWWRFDAQTGGLHLAGELSSLPAGFAGTSFASDLCFAPDGRQLFCLNRLHDSIAIFALAEDGEPRLQAHEWTRGSYPRSCTLDPSGRALYVCNQRSDHLSVFRLHEQGGLAFTGQYVAVPSPAHLVFAP